MDAERKKIVEETARRVEEEYRLREAEKDKQLQDGHCHVNRKFADQMTMAVTVHAATVAWRHVSIA